MEFNEINALIDNPYAGESYSKFVLNILPDSLDSDRRALKRELIAAVKMTDSSHVMQKVKALIADAYKPGAPPMMKMTVAEHDQLQRQVKQALAASSSRKYEVRSNETGIRSTFRNVKGA